MMYQMTITIEVLDAKALHQAALKRLQDDFPGDFDAQRLIGDEEEPDVHSCLVALLDPGVSPDGTSILDSSAERISE